MGAPARRADDLPHGSVPRRGRATPRYPPADLRRRPRVVRRRPRRVLDRDRRALRGRLRRTRDLGPGRRVDARCRLVPRCTAELRRTGAPGPGRTRHAGNVGRPSRSSAGPRPGTRSRSTRAELADQVARAAAGLRRLGVDRGDRVVGYLPNVPETAVAFLACASIGAVWSSCAPEFGVTSVVDRVRQIDPAVLLAVDGYRYGTKDVDRAAEVAAIREALPTLRATVVLPYLDPDAAARADPGRDDLGRADRRTGARSRSSPCPSTTRCTCSTARARPGCRRRSSTATAASCSSTCKILGLHHDLGDGDVFCWFTTTGWMMWNYLVSGLHVGATIVTFDGDPGHPDLTDPVAPGRRDRAATCSASARRSSCTARRAGLTPGADLDLSALRSIGSTGSPLPPEGFAWVYERGGRRPAAVLGLRRDRRVQRVRRRRAAAAGPRRRDPGRHPRQRRPRLRPRRQRRSSASAASS